jgi:cytochrome c551/c552
VVFVALLFPAAFAGWAVGHYTSLGGKPSATVVHTITAGSTAAATTSAFTTTSAATTTSGGTTTSSGGGGNAAAGEAVFNSSGCASCHTFKPAGATGTVGPDLDKAPASDAKADKNMALAAFVHESIVNPDAYVAKGYSKGVMPTTFGSSLSSSQLNNLVAFIVSGSSSS